MTVNIGGFQKSSLIDYPEKISAIIFTQGCNFRCPYCHNPELIEVKSEKKKVKSRVGLLSHQKESNTTTTSVLDFLASRQGKLDGVVITGGEPTLQKSLPEFIKQIKDLVFLIKLDTNGSNPEMLQYLLEENLIDYVAMDIKAPIEKYPEITNAKINTENILKSIELLKAYRIEHEYRTTVVKSQLSPADFEQIGKMIKGADKYYLQRFVPTKTLNEAFLNETTYSDEEFAQIIYTLQKYVKQVELR